MFSLNIPVPGEVAALASDIAREMPDARARVRGEHTFCVKRLETDDATDYDHIEARSREVLAGEPSFDVKITGLDYFPEALIGSSPVVYLAVESDDLRALHRRLVDAFDRKDPIEGKSYTPHVTVARGGSVERADEIVERDIDTIDWTVSELVFWDAENKRRVSTISLN